ncbi:uncharacterized protein LOC135492680 [Lineus longissimus]|uniref:uncharacterized protein LOC135492680 n=1 Tax=Lineus longissimus TaxID=88925 RepID=UPI00315D57C8
MPAWSSDSSDSDIEVLTLYLYDGRRKRKRRHQYWVHPILKERAVYGEYHHLVKKLFGYEDKFFLYFRMMPEHFNLLLDNVKGYITKEYTAFRRPIGPEERLAICLRFLATGDSYKTIAFSYYVGVHTVSKIIQETCQAIWDALQPMYMPQPNRAQWEDIADGFGRKWQFPCCLGAMDGKHVQIFAPANSGTLYFNYKKTFSVVLLALVDWNYCFTVIDVGSYGSNSDGGIFKRSTLGKKLMNGTLEIPANKCLPGAEQRVEPVPHVVVGDEAFPAMENLLRPFPGKNLRDDQRIFNYRLSRARRISENAFGILANRWRLYHRKIPLSAESVDIVVKATCVLHNMLQNRGVPVPVRPVTDDVTPDEEDTCDGILNDLEKSGHRQKKDALMVREAYKDYFSSRAGAVPWQNQVCFGED